MNKDQQGVFLDDSFSLVEMKVHQSKEKLKLLMLNYDSTLASLPGLKQELEHILAVEESLEYGKLLARIETSLQDASEWLANIGLLPVELAKNERITTLIAKFQAMLNLENITALLARFVEVRAEVGAEYDALDELIVWADKNLISHYRFDEESQCWSGLPRDKDVLLSLTTLDLRKSKFSTIPECIGSLSKLKRLNLKDSQLHHLPDSIGKLVNLEILELSGNQLQHLPGTIGQLANLKVLELKGNHLLAVPDTIGQLSQLEALGLWGNQLQALPESLGDLGNLKVLNVGFNQLQVLPESIVRLGALKNLDLEFNQLYFLPNNLAELAKLETINLEFNSELATLPEGVLAQQSITLALAGTAVNLEI